MAIDKFDREYEHFMHKMELREKMENEPGFTEEKWNETEARLDREFQRKESSIPAVKKPVNNHSATKRGPVKWSQLRKRRPNGRILWEYM